MKRLFLLVIVGTLLASWSIAGTRYVPGRNTHLMDSVRFMVDTNGAKWDSSGWVEDTYGKDTILTPLSGKHTSAYWEIKYTTAADGDYVPWVVGTFDLTTASYMDSIFYWLTLGVGNKSHTDYDSDQDTITIVSESDDTLGYIIYYHIGGTAGAAPDSVKVVTGP
jgi:hypothetical protein